MGHLQTYMRAYYPSVIVSETIDTKVGSRHPPTSPPRGAYAVRFYERIHAVEKGEELESKSLNWSPTYVWGEAFTLAEIEAQFPDERVLIDNVRINGYVGAIRTAIGSWQLWDKSTVVVAA